MLTDSFLAPWEPLRTEINLSEYPSFFKIFHEVFLFTVSKTFIRSVKTSYGSIFCSIHFYCNCLKEMIMSAILLKYLKTHWVSGKNLSGILLRSLSSRTLGNTLPTTERRDILQSSQEPPLAHFSNLLEHALLSKPFILS